MFLPLGSISRAGNENPFQLSWISVMQAKIIWYYDTHIYKSLRKSPHMPSSTSSRLRVCTLDMSPQNVNSTSVAIEKALGFLGEIQLIELNSLDDPNFFPADLLIVKAEQIPHDEIPKWLAGFAKRVQQQGKIWTPALVVSSCDYSTLQGFMPTARSMNWYFDIVSPDHISSLPIRVSNLLRMHDHLHELKRYDEQVQVLQEQVLGLEKELKELSSHA